MRSRRHDSLAAEAAFRAQLTGLGAVLLEAEWRGLTAKHYVRCSEGHDCHPTPASVRRGQGICLVCARRDPARSEAAFRARLAALGAVMVGQYVNSKTSVHVRCAFGHDCYPRPDRVVQGAGICSACARNNPATAEAAFRRRLTELAAVPLYKDWQGSGRPHKVRCRAGHECYPRPNDVQQGDGICRTCSGYATATAEGAFRDRLTGLGAVPAYERWLGTKARHHVICPAGHDAYPTPGSIRDGQGPCAACAHNGEWDTFYVVTSPQVVKFGVTSGDPRDRLSDHARNGLTDLTRLATGLSGTVAPDSERAVRQALALADEKPVRGREYFGISCLAVILDITDSWLTAAPDLSRGSVRSAPIPL